MKSRHQELLRRFKRELADQGKFESLFEHFSDIYFFIKDANYQLLTCNEACLQLFNLKEKSEIEGKTEYDFFPRKMADLIHADDVQVIEHQRPVVRRMELIVAETGMTVWASTTKLPLMKLEGSVAGLMGTTRIIQDPDYIRTHYNQPIRVGDLAKMCHLSVSRFRESFTEVYKMSPQQFIIRLRIQMACRQLSHADTDIASVAQDCGFCDQSYFTRQFREHVGLTPLAYRNRYAVGTPAYDTGG